MSEHSATARASALTFGSAEFDRDEYARTARLARLEEVRLLDCTYNVKINYFLANDASDGSLQQAYSGEVSGYHFEKDNGIAAGAYSWRAEVKSNRKKILSMKAEYMLMYSGLSDANVDYVRLYFQKLARFTSYPFFRAHFAVQTSASGLNIGPLPSLFERVD